MRKLIVSEFVTLDGVMQAPGGKDEDRDGGFAHGGWTMPYWHDDIGKTFFDLMQDVDAVAVRSTHLRDARGGVRADAQGRPVWRYDECTQKVCGLALVFPLTLGSGKRVLPDGLHATFGLRSAKPYPTGVVGLHYVRQRGGA